MLLLKIWLARVKDEVQLSARRSCTVRVMLVSHGYKYVHGKEHDMNEPIDTSFADMTHNLIYRWPVLPEPSSSSSPSPTSNTSRS